MTEHAAQPLWGGTERGDRLRWAGSIVVAVLLHAAVLVVLWVDFAPAPQDPSESPMAAMLVEIAPLPSATRTQQSERPPGPEQVEQKRLPTPRPVEQRPKFDPPPEVRSDPPPDALPSSQPEREVPRQETEAAEQTSAAPSSQARPDDVQQAPVEGAPNDRASTQVQTWQGAVMAHLEHHKRYPRMAQQRRQEDVVYLRFKIDRTGRVLEGDVWRSAGHALLDREVGELIMRASPLPPPPAEIGGDPIEMIIPVEFFLNRGVAAGGRR